jgi:hypothetical protein
MPTEFSLVVLKKILYRGGHNILYLKSPLLASLLLLTSLLLMVTLLLLMLMMLLSSMLLRLSMLLLASMLLLVFLLLLAVLLLASMLLPFPCPFVTGTQGAVTRVSAVVGPTVAGVLAS